MKQKLVFEGVAFNVVDHQGQPCLTLTEIAMALYRKGGVQTATPFAARRVRDLYRRHADEFSDSMTALVKLQTPGGEQQVRIFSLRGAHLLGMLARTEQAKRFRRWALDVLDRHLVQGESLTNQFHAALSDYSSKQAMASLFGRGLNEWKRQKAPLEARLHQLSEQIQRSLLLH